MGSLPPLYRRRMSITPFQAGPYRGYWHAAWAASPALLDSLSAIRGWVEQAESLPSLGRHAIARHVLDVNGTQVPLAIKSFSRSSFWRDQVFRKHGSKAERSFRAAVRLVERGVGTPRPFACLDRWEQGRLLESYYLCQHEEDISSFRDELNRLYREDPLCRRIMTLMETAALAIADLHDAGVCHRDLGNQNVLLRRRGEDAWCDVRFIDLNRALIADALTLRERARDISRIDLPSDFLRVFKCMYFRHQHPPEEFNNWEDRYRRRFAMHTATRKYRHPLREARQRKKDAFELVAPRGRELWVWDDRSQQAVSTLLSRDRHAYYPAANHFHIAKGMLRASLPVWSRYRDYMASAFRQPVTMAGRVGMAVGGGADETGWLKPFGRMPLLLRLYRHEGDAANEKALAWARHAREQGHSIFVALVQDRAAVRDPRLWRRFVDAWLPQLDGLADWVEVGHAFNRVKWGLWDLGEYLALLDPVLKQTSGNVSFKVCGPAAIDFEYHYLAGLLDRIPHEGCFHALSHLLYVDRRGAPENLQGRFAAVEKFALARAVASWSPAFRSDQLIVSEVNWPISGTGEFSPVNSPYIIPGSHRNDPSVDEQTYADYMIRYYALALCSGLVDRVYWWKLVARGFGLIDDTDPAQARPRPAYHALTTFVRLLGEAVFLERVEAGEGIWALRFRQKDGRPLVLAWAHPGQGTYRPDFTPVSMVNRDGTDLAAKSGALGGSPVYFLG